MAKVYGIDLGATYSVISTLNDNGMPEIVANLEEGSNLLASAVYFPENGEPVVGEVAKDQKYIEPERVVECINRCVGNSDAFTYVFDGVTYDPVVISALIIKRMVQYAFYQGHDVRDVVITCPAWFGVQEKSAIKNAANMAGLNVLNIIADPVAAALPYCCRGIKNNSKILVYDLGGAGFDLALLEYKNDENRNSYLDVIRIDGNDRLGGIDWDARMYDYMCEEYAFENGISEFDMEVELQQEIRAKAEHIKKALSTHQKKNCAILYAGDKTRIALTREDFESRTQDLVELTMDTVTKLLDDCGVSADNVDVVLLVGGSTKMPMIRTAVEAMFPGKVRVEDPDLAIAKGAVLAGNINIGELFPDTTPEIIIDDGPRAPVFKKSIGIKLFSKDGMLIKNLLYMNGYIYQEATYVLNTSVENQKSLKIELYENVSTDEEVYIENLDIEEDSQAAFSKIGEVSIELSSGMPVLTPIELHLYYDGTLHVSAKNLLTGEEFETNIFWPTKEI